MNVFDRLLMTGLVGAFALLGVFFVGWAGLLLLLQMVGWLGTGYWQPLPLFLLFISEPAQQMLQFYGGAQQPMQFVPAWGSADSAHAVALVMSPRMVGVQQILVWCLEISLVGWLLAAAFLALFAASAAYAEAQVSQASAAT